ncbi:MAG: phosphosulfolactate synthase [Gammaproteobacteria bacterium]
MSEFAWGNIVGSLITDRSQKPRERGQTMIIDTGMGVSMVRDILDLASQSIDLWKLGFGTSAFYSKKTLQNKLSLLADHGILSLPGGTLLEVALVEHHCRVYMKQAKSLGFTVVEISDGTIQMPAFRRKNIIHCALDAGLIPITEVGKKDPRQQPSAEQIAEQALEDLENGARWVIIEGREGGKAVGIFGEHGQVIEDDLATIVRIMDTSVDRLIWEAPLKEQQAYLIGKLGTNVGIGNIHPDQILAVEALRCRLRFETLHSMAEQLVRSGSWDPNLTEPHCPEGEAVVYVAK